MKHHVLTDSSAERGADPQQSNSVKATDLSGPEAPQTVSAPKKVARSWAIERNRISFRTLTFFNFVFPEHSIGDRVDGRESGVATKWLKQGAQKIAGAPF